MIKRKGIVKFGASVFEDVEVEYMSFVDRTVIKWSGGLTLPEEHTLFEGTICELLLDNGQRATIRIEKKMKSYEGYIWYGFNVIDTLQ